MNTLPLDTPVTTPPPLIVAMDPAALLHVPPGTVSVSVIVAPAHTEEAPEIAPAEGSGITVMVSITEVDPQVLVNV